jgi:choline-sulfatase
VTSPVSLVDLFPTPADLVGSDWPRDCLDGASLCPFLHDADREDPDRCVITEYYGESIRHPFRAAVRGSLKYVHFPDKTENDLLYDLASDPDETINVVGRETHRAQAEQLLSAIRAGFDYPAFKEEIRRSITHRSLLQRTVADPAERPWRYYPDGWRIMSGCTPATLNFPGTVACRPTACWSWTGSRARSSTCRGRMPRPRC